MEKIEKPTEDNSAPKPTGSPVAINSIWIELKIPPENINETKVCQHNFSIRGFAAAMRTKNPQASNPFASDGDPSAPQVELPPIHVPKYRWWRCPECLREIENGATEENEPPSSASVNAPSSAEIAMELSRAQQIPPARTIEDIDINASSSDNKETSGQNSRGKRNTRSMADLHAMPSGSSPPSPPNKNKMLQEEPEGISKDDSERTLTDTEICSTEMQDNASSRPCSRVRLQIGNRNDRTRRMTERTPVAIVKRKRRQTQVTGRSSPRPGEQIASKNNTKECDLHAAAVDNLLSEKEQIEALETASKISNFQSSNVEVLGKKSHSWDLNEKLAQNENEQNEKETSCHKEKARDVHFGSSDDIPMYAQALTGDARGAQRNHFEMIQPEKSKLSLYDIFPRGQQMFSHGAQDSERGETSSSSRAVSMSFGLGLQQKCPHYPETQHRGKTISDIKADELRKAQENQIILPRSGSTELTANPKGPLDPYANESSAAMQLLSLKDGRSVANTFNMGSRKGFAPYVYHRRQSTTGRRDFLNGSLFRHQNGRQNFSLGESSGQNVQQNSERALVRVESESVLDVQPIRSFPPEEHDCTTNRNPAEYCPPVIENHSIIGWKDRIFQKNNSGAKCPRKAKRNEQPQSPSS